MLILFFGSLGLGVLFAMAPWLKYEYLVPGCLQEGHTIAVLRSLRRSYVHILGKSCIICISVHVSVLLIICMYEYVYIYRGVYMSAYIQMFILYPLRRTVAVFKYYERCGFQSWLFKRARSLS